MGIQDKGEVTLIRHAYVWTRAQKLGIGTERYHYLESLTEKPILIGTWATALGNFILRKERIYLVSEQEKNCLLRKYWSIPERQVEISVVLEN